MAKPARKGKGIAPTLEQTSTGIETTAKAGRETKGGKPMNFNMDPEWVIDFKTYAASNNMSMKELLEKAFAHYKKDHG